MKVDVVFFFFFCPHPPHVLEPYVVAKKLVKCRDPSKKN